MEKMQGIDWAHISREDFERFVEALLVRWYRSDPGLTATAVDGRGGDSGIDVDVRRNDKTVKIYQLKHFPEGFSGGFIKRRKQISNSFDVAAKADTLEEWTLVVPCNGTPSERKVISSLRGSHKFRVKFLGRAELDEMFAQHPDLLAWATRAPLIEALRQAGNEKAGLVGPNDLGERQRDLDALANTRSAFWRVDTSIRNGIVTHEYVAKRPDAAEREPISVTFSTDFRAEHEHLRKDYQRALDFGFTEPLKLPADVVSAFRVLGPEWIAHESDRADVEFGPKPPPKRITVEARAIKPSGATVASLRGEITVLDSGLKGMSFVARFRSEYAMTFTLPKGVDSGSVTMTYNTLGVGATDAFAVLRFIRALEPPNKMQILVDGSQAFVSKVPTGIKNKESSRVDEILYSLADDLSALERHFGVTFTIPPGITALDRVNVRLARMLAEGRCAIWPRMTGFDAVLSSEADQEMIDRIKIAHFQAMRFPDWEFEVLGQSLLMGTLRTFHPSMQLRSPERFEKYAQEGKLDGKTIHVEATDHTAFAIWIEDEATANTQSRIPEPWGLDGIEEDPGLATTRKALNA